MEFVVDKETLTIFFEGNINSFNAEEVEKEIDTIMSQNTFKKVVLDMEHLRYVSSAGLRIIVRIKKQCDDTSLIKVPPMVNDVFEMVGFQNLLTIEKL